MPTSSTENRILSLISQCSTKAGATEQALEQLTAGVGIELPSDYLWLLAHSNGVEGFVGDNYLYLWPAEDVREYGIYETMPFLVFVGSDGASEGFAYDTRDSSLPLVNVPFIGMDPNLVRVIGRNMLEFLERLNAGPLF